LAQQLVAEGEVVFDVPPMLASRVRLLGTGRSQKNDPNDARSVAIAALRSERLTTVSPEDHSQVLRMLAKRHRDMSRTRAKAKTRLHALMLELRAGGLDSKMSVTKAEAFLETVSVTDAVVRHRMVMAHELVAEIAELDARLKSSNKRMSEAVLASGTTVTDVVGIGPFCAATIIGYTGDIGRFATKSHYATYNATAPIEASSGDHARHRLNPRGNRHLNHVIHIAAVSQLAYESEGRAYYDRKRAEGKSGKEAIRCLKRKISDAVYRRLVKDLATKTQVSPQDRTTGTPGVPGRS